MPTVTIHPVEIRGYWDRGYVLDRHTISSTMIGYNEYGHPEFDTVRSELGELVYRLKYKGDKSVLPSIVETTAEFLQTQEFCPSVVIPMPPSKLQRAFQPVVEISSALAKNLGVPVDSISLAKTKATPQMKDIGDFAARMKELESVFTTDQSLSGQQILLVDDLFQSGASMNVAARVLKQEGLAGSVYALALTRTRS